MKKKKEIEAWLERYEVSACTINQDLTIDSKYEIDLSNRQLKELPYKFNKVEGTFSIYNNQLTSLKNVPNLVGNNFICSLNHLTNLDFSPNVVENSYYCTANPFDLNHMTYPIHFNNYFYHCTVKEKEFLNEFKNLYQVEKDEDGFGFILELTQAEFKVNLEKYDLEKNILLSDNKIKVMKKLKL
jgi:hypothetical protein